MPEVVVGAAFGQPGLQRQDRRGSVQRLDLGLLVHAQHDRVLRRRQVQPDDVGDLGRPARGRWRTGTTPPATAGPRSPATPWPPWRREIPSCRASSRVDQCVTPSFFGGGVSVAVTIAAWSIARGRPDRGSSSSPAIPARPGTAPASRSPSAATPPPAPRSRYWTPRRRPATRSAPAAPTPPAPTTTASTDNSSRSPSRNPNAGSRSIRHTPSIPPQP